jgi:cytochrome P450
VRLIRAARSWLTVLARRNYSSFTGEMWTPTRKLFLVSHPDLVDRVLSRESDRFPKSNLTGSLMSLLIGDGIFASNGERWKTQRRMMDPAFELARIKDVFPLMRDATEAMAARLRAHAHGAVVAIEEETTHVAADIIFRTIFSRALEREESGKLFRAFVRFQERIHSHGVWVIAGVPGFLLPGRFFAARHAREIRDFLDREVQRRLDALAAGSEASRADILASLLEAVDPVTGDKFTRRELVDQIAVMFLAGHETSASALAWALYLIAMRPDIQERMHEEAVSALADRRPEFADMRRLKLTRDVFRETLRLYPPLSHLDRDATQPERMRSRVLKKGDMVFISPWIIHRHRKLWEKPDVFDPDRFADPASRESVRSAYIPFGAGPRVCLGASFAMQEATLILADLVRNFRFEPAPGHVPEPVARLTLRSKNGIRLRVFRRQPGQQVAVGGATDAIEEPAKCPYR